ncbi:hypothetical protein MP228_013104 [Amoeboaphelidium protococcarum]|nr:hypothetical protein MP228_013104 [Amoeboaphelidium protococcarum]
MADKSEQVLDVIQQRANGISSQDILKEVDVKVEDLGGIINQLSGQKKITIMTGDNNEVILKAVSESEQQLMKQMTPEEYGIYTHVQESGGSGIWMRDILNKTGFHRSVVTKAIKNLMNLNYIKSITNVKCPTRKMYICCGVTPNSEIVGGMFYQNSTLDADLVRQLTLATTRFIASQDGTDARGSSSMIASVGHGVWSQNGGYGQSSGGSSGSGSSNNISLEVPTHNGVTSNQILKFVKEQTISEMELSLADLEQLLTMLTYDRTLIQYQDGNTVKWRLHPQSAQSQLSSDGGAHIKFNNWSNSSPCSMCPVHNECTPGGIISPQSCVYIKDWLEI